MSEAPGARLLAALRAEARAAPESGIVAVVNHARGRDGLIPLWVGEGDSPTPAFIVRAASRALEAGETFYTWQRGVPELRRALADYHARHFGRPFVPERFIVTGGGMQAIRLALEAVAGAGDEIVYLSPAWPNFPAAFAIAGGRPVAVGLERGAAGWRLDPDRLAAAITPRTRALFVNTPSNPTGWTADRATLAAILTLARRHGLWIIADEIYSRFVYDAPRAASFHDIADDDDRILHVNSFSKNWAMTGWRVGWLEVHPALQQVFENLVQYATSGVAAFMQRGAVAALDEGDGFVDAQVARAGEGRDRVCAILQATGRVRLAPPAGAFYLFFSIDGVADTRAAALRIVDETGVGLAPGTAFGPGGEACFRLCFNRRIDQLEAAAHRLAAWLGDG
ncbi:pyridoxal phosphate-dependent aminotransferase [Aquibium sp. A9E412]|uniref:pyridoxal phosphate-dependent aminotransferase n=1 Tax=Aquibium sp. A9E412 TaxID=2976767 RepID=UPI0025B05E06|nr:pyridoxal phosphate-dependent aminotransferase [Aquibium sp. A9E412]MDN2565873.1 pyridoxal phosphate-dependent aminotransferase [Aquibium sp. A9E412]